MSRFQLCRERLNRILSILDRNAGALTVRDFTRTYNVWEWELQQAEELGWVQIETRKPHTGRPSRVVRNVSEYQARKYPPYRHQIEKPIAIRHDNFAYYSVAIAIKGGERRYFGMPPFTAAYQKAFPAARSRAGAAASMSRLLRHPDVRIARQWYYASLNHEIPRTPVPETARAMWQQLRDAGSWRVR